MPRSRHARPRPPIVPILVGGVVAVVLVAVLALAISRAMGSEMAAYQPSLAPSITPESSAPVRASQSCEREAVRSLARLVTARPSSSYEGTMQLAEERQRLSPQAYQAVEATLNSVQIEFEQAGATGLAQIITAHKPQIRQACATG